MVGHLFRFHPAVRKLRELLAEGHFGAIYSIDIIRKAVDSDRDVPDDLMDKIQEWLFDKHPDWMPYGTMKARTGDPYNWIMDHIDEILAQLQNVNESTSDEKEYGVFPTGGSIGSDNSKPWKTGNKADMKEYAKRMRKQLTPGERGYYGLGYSVRPIKK